MKSGEKNGAYCISFLSRKKSKVFLRQERIFIHNHCLQVSIKISKYLKKTIKSDLPFLLYRFYFKVDKVDKYKNSSLNEFQVSLKKFNILLKINFFSNFYIISESSFIFDIIGITVFFLFSKYLTRKTLASELPYQPCMRSIKETILRRKINTNYIKKKAYLNYFV